MLIVEQQIQEDRVSSKWSNIVTATADVFRASGTHKWFFYSAQKSSWNITYTYDRGLKLFSL